MNNEFNWLESVNYTEKSVYHIELSDDLFGIRIIENIFSREDFHTKMWSCYSDNFYIPGLYFEYFTGSTGIYCVFIYSPDGKLHCLSNDYLCAHETLSNFVFENNESYYESEKHLKIKSNWDFDEVVIRTFFDTISGKINYGYHR